MGMSRTRKIPVGWVETTLGEFMKFKNGVNADKGAYGRGTKFVNVMDIFKKSFLKEDDITGAVQITEKQLSEYSVVNGDILFNRTSETPEEIAYSAVYTGDETITFGGFVIRGRQTKNFLLPEFVRHCFKSNRIRKEMIRRSQGKVRANIGQKDLNKIPILIPTKNEQEKIAHILSTWDMAIEKTECLIAAKEKQFDTLILCLINKRCKKWTHHRVKDLLDNVSKRNAEDQELLSVTQDRGVIPRTMLEGRVMSPVGSTTNYKIVETGDFVISLRSFQGGIEYSRYRGAVSPAYTVLKTKKPLCDRFYRHFFKSHIFVNKYLGIAVIGIRDGKQISFPDFQSVNLPYPPLAEQKYIANTLDNAEQEISLLKQLAEKHRTQKRGLMQRLLTGKWRIKR